MKIFRTLGKDGKPVTSSFHFHYARLIELMFSLERIAELMDDPETMDTHIRAQGGVNEYRGVGIMEAPRGTLIHEYEVNPDGILTKANLLVATGNNNLAMNKTVKQIAQGLYQRLQDHRRSAEQSRARHSVCTIRA